MLGGKRSLIESEDTDNQEHIEAADMSPGRHALRSAAPMRSPLPRYASPDVCSMHSAVSMGSPVPGRVPTMLSVYMRYVQVQ